MEPATDPTKVAAIDAAFAREAHGKNLQRNKYF